MTLRGMQDLFTVTSVWVPVWPVWVVRASMGSVSLGQSSSTLSGPVGYVTVWASLETCLGQSSYTQSGPVLVIHCLGQSGHVWVSLVISVWASLVMSGSVWLYLSGPVW